MYGTLTGWRTWAAERGNTAPTDADDADATAALVRASDYIEFAYVQRFVPPWDSTAPNVEPATYVAANLELETPGFFSKTYTPAEQKILTEVKGIKWTVVEMDSNAPNAVLSAPVSSQIENMLAPYLPPEKDAAFLKAVGVRCRG